MSVVFLFVLVGCAGHHQAYPGARRPPGEIAVLFTRPDVSPGAGTVWTGKETAPTLTSIRVVELDGKKGFSPAASNKSVEIEILPGAHTVKAEYGYTYRAWSANGVTSSGWAWGDKKAILQFHAEPGRRYELAAETLGGHWTALIQDVTGLPRVVARPSGWED